jgi:hypothetical protein
MRDGCEILLVKARNEESIDASESYEVDSTIEIRPVNGNLKECKMFLSRDDMKCYRKYGEKNQKNRKIYINCAKRVIQEDKQYNSEQLNSPKEKIYIRELYRCRECGFYVYESPYCIKEMGRYYTAARCTGVRVITVSPHDHYNNEEWVQKEETWKIVWKVINDIIDSLQLKELPIERIYINFGHWQSQTKNDRLRPRYCHAHINIVLTKKAIEACKG